MNERRRIFHRFCIVLLMAGLIFFGGSEGDKTSALASPGMDVFEGFTNHIITQIRKDKYKFSIADTCTSWFYKQKSRQSKPLVQEVQFSLRQSEGDVNCARLFPEGLQQARQAFGDTQQRLSLSLTFFQMALVGDGNDDQQYSAGEIHDVLESFGRPFHDGQPVGRYTADLTSLFDTVWGEVQFKFLMEGMQTLMNKGYRFTSADQTALTQELNGSPDK